MTNGEFYKREIIEMFAFDADTNKIQPCKSTFCGKCLFDSLSCTANKLKWLHEEYLPKIDWSKVEPHTMVEVSDDCKHWVKRKFATYFDDTIYCKKPSDCDKELINWKYGRLIKGDNTES